MRSFFRLEKQRPQPGSADEPFPAARASTHIQGNSELYNVLHSPYLRANATFNDAPISSDLSASARFLHSDQCTDTARSSSNEVEVVTANVITSTSSSATRSNPSASMTSTPLPIQVEGTLTISAFAKPRPVSTQASNPSSDLQGFVFGNGGDDLDRGHKSKYFDKIKNNPYTGALIPRAPSPSIPIPHNATEARDLFKRGRYNQPKRDPVPQPTVEELQKVLQDLRKRFAKLKATCDTAGIIATHENWKQTAAVVEDHRPDIRRALDEDTGKGLKEYKVELECWDKAVGHHAILMKRLHCQQQIAAVEKRIKEALVTAAVKARNADEGDEGSQVAKENGEEWKGHKTKFGRRFSGLIEKN